jgi:PIN domain nuclease of toxin-antitoxin system
VRLLLDTSAFLWTTAAPTRLGRWRDLIEDPHNDRIVSVVCAWEIAITWSLERLVLPEPPATYFSSRVRRLAATVLVIEETHALAVADLPRHHRDPFDRLLIAQARALDVPILTADRAFQAYDVELLFIE